MSVTFLVILMMALFGVFIVLPIYLIDGLGFEAIAIGALMLPGGLLMGLLGPFVGRLYDRFGPRPLVIPGAAVTSLALWGMASFGPDTNLLVHLRDLHRDVPRAGVPVHAAVHLGDRRASSPPLLARKRDHRDRAAGGGSRRNRHLRRLPSDRHLPRPGRPTRSSRRQIRSSPEHTSRSWWAAFISLAGVVAAFFVRKPDHPEVSDEELAAAVEESEGQSSLAGF